jgi:nucleoside-diphosphate-sugar epimerase
MVMPEEQILVAEAGGFIGGHFVDSLSRDGARVRAVDIKPLDAWFQASPDADNRRLDLSRLEACEQAVEGVSAVYNLAADMGGIGFIERHKARCMLSVLVNTHLLLASAAAGVRRYFYASSACIYKVAKQQSLRVTPLREEDAFPAMPEDGYGWEELFSERMCRYFHEDLGMQVRVARYHNVYGPHGAWFGGREKAPPPCVARSSKPPTGARARSRCGATASRPAASSTSTTASRARGGSWLATSRSPSIWARMSSSRSTS